jgi:sulfite oxidase
MAVPAVAHGTPQQGSGKLEDFEVKGEAPYYAEEREGWKGYIEWEVCLSR